MFYKNWLVLSDEQMCKEYPFSRNDEQISNRLGVERLSDSRNTFLFSSVSEMRRLK